MRKKFAAAAALACVLAFSGCGSAAGTADGVTSTASVKSYSGSSLSSGYSSDGLEVTSESASVSYSSYDTDTADSVSSSASDSNPVVDEAAKKIYTGSIYMETTAFASVYSGIRSLAESYGGWMESDNTGTSGIDDAQYANMTIRVPAANFSGLVSGLDGLEDATVTSKNISTDDVSETYYDLEGRLENAKEKLETLQGLSKEADNVSDMLAIEDSISETQYTIEYLQGQLDSYDSKVSYSTVYVYLDEVNVVSGHEEGYGNKLLAGLKSGFVDGLDTIGDIILWAAQRWLVLLVIIGIIAWIRKGRKKRRAKRNADRNNGCGDSNNNSGKKWPWDQWHRGARAVNTGAGTERPDPPGRKNG